MEFAKEQLVIFTVMLSSIATVALFFTVWAAFRAWKAEGRQQRFEWIPAVVFGLLTFLFFAFQLYRIVIRF